MPLYFIIAFLFAFALCRAAGPRVSEKAKIITGAERTTAYLPLLEGKNIALVANHTSNIGNVHLVDTLMALGIRVKKVFAPEHGFRGEAEDGAHIASGFDHKSGVNVVSIYGKSRKPSPADLHDIDVVLFDIQDVGARFYTFISTMSLVMEACAEQGIPFLVLDRPNPNGFYVDGPLLDPAFSSFVGMHPVPVVHGMTVGEYAQMVNGEGWLAKGVKCDLTVIPMLNYNRNSLYQLPVRPSPNLPDMTSVYLYPSLCFFEGTIMSVGRGTDMPFRIIGHPEYTFGNVLFKPESIAGVSVNPPHKDKICIGKDLSYLSDSIITNKRLYLQPLIDAFHFFKNREEFFTSYFNKLAGSAKLQSQIKAGLSEAEIRKSWQEDLASFKKMRKKYLIYP